MEENKKDVLPLEGEPLTTPQISEPVVNALAAALSKIETYVPTQYIDDGPPDIDADHLNHAEQAIMRVTNLANGAADAIAALQSQVTQLNNNFQLLDNATRFAAGSFENTKAYMRTNNLNGEMFQFVLNESGSHFAGYYGKYGDSGKTLWTGATKSDLANKTKSGSATISTKQNDSTALQIRFDEPFPSRPYVTVSLNTDNANTNTKISVFGIDQTGFKVSIYDTAATTRRIEWIASV